MMQKTTMLGIGAAILTAGAAVLHAVSTGADWTTALVLGASGLLGLFGYHAADAAPAK
jgi:hypothetical protein